MLFTPKLKITEPTPFSCSPSFGIYSSTSASFKLSPISAEILFSKNENNLSNVGLKSWKLIPIDILMKASIIAGIWGSSNGKFSKSFTKRFDSYIKSFLYDSYSSLTEENKYPIVFIQFVLNCLCSGVLDSTL